MARTRALAPKADLHRCCSPRSKGTQNRCRPEANQFPQCAILTCCMLAHSKTLASTGPSLLLRGESQQDITGNHSSMMRIAGLQVDHASCNCRTGITHGAALGVRSVYGRVILDALVMLDNLPRVRRIGEKLTVHSAGEDDSRHRRHGSSM